MFTDRTGRSKHDLVLDALRRRICLAPPEEELRLHETALAEEFEMSRTPIRQILQRLAYERLVETKSGVGTIATAMRAAERARDLTTHRGLLRAILDHEMGALSLMEQSTVSALGALVERAPALDREIAFEARSGLLTLLARLIDDPVLCDAFQASGWRVIRWRLRDFDEAAEAEGLKALVAGAVEASAQGAPQLFRCMLERDLAV